MGGIVGIRYASDESDEKLLVEKMLQSISHRAKHCLVDNSLDSVCFGARYHGRENQSQSVAHDKLRDVLVVIDGDIFKFPEDISFTGAEGDAEAVVRLYRKYGLGFVDKIDGSYAIAIWDGKKEQLLLVRDRLGFKPLFYTRQGNSFLFSSEIKAILQTGLCEKRVDNKAVDSFLSYWYVPNPDTMFETVHQVRPGHVLILKNGNIEHKEYWKFEYNHPEIFEDEKFYQEKFLDVFLTAVSRRLKKYPECGAFLSGGLDSSGVAAAMYQIKQSPFKVFSGGFKEKEHNEIGDAAIVADHLGLEHLTTIIQFDSDFPALLEKIVYYHDSPFSDTSAIPSYFASKLAKENVDVVLTGDFPDQILGGSGHYIKALKFQENQNFINRIFQSSFCNYVVRQLPLSSGTATFFDKIKRKIYRDTFSIEEQRIITNMPVPELMKPCLYSKEFLKIHKNNNPLFFAKSIYDSVKNYNLIDRMLYFDTLSYAVDDLMVKVERMTSANALIAISPFHDIDFVEFVASLPSYLKIKNMEGKYIMKKAVKHLLPDHTLKKEKKGFDMPIEAWLIQKNPDYVRDVLFDSTTLNRGYFNKNFMHKMVNDFINQKTDYASGSAATIISLITLELWHRLFVDK